VELPHHDILICAAHFIGDGMALHQFANDFFNLLGSTKTDSELETDLYNECLMRWARSSDEESVIPLSVDSRLPSEGNKFCQAVAMIDFKRNQEKLIGGHAFPRRSSAPRRTVVPTVAFDAQRTKAILRNCKTHNVSVSAALFAICNFAWAKLTTDKAELPLMMYSALNLRPYLNPTGNDSYWFLAIGFFNVILSNFIPKSVDNQTAFWQRARSAKEQSARAAKSSMIVSRSRLMARQRSKQSRVWAKEDDEKLRGAWRQPAKDNYSTPKSDQVPSTALIGLSLLGNLDGIYKHANFPDIELDTLTTGSRQRAGGMLLFGYTFAGKLWVSLGYDEKGFEEGVVQKFWCSCLDAIDTFL